MEKSTLLAIILTLLIGAGALWITLAWMDSGEAYVNLDQPSSGIQGQVSAEGDHQEFRLAVSTMWSPEETFLRYHRLGVRLGQMLEMKETFVIRSTYREVREALEAAEVEAALVCTGTLMNTAVQDSVEILAVPEFLDGLKYRGEIVVPADSPAVSLRDLRGTVMAMTDPESFTGCTLPCAALLSITRDLKGFLKGVVFTGSHDRAVEAVASRLVDSAAVYSLIYDAICMERPEIKNRTRVLWESDPFDPPPFLVPATLPPIMKTKIQRALLSFHEDPEGYKLLKELGIRKFVAPQPGAFDSARALYEQVRSAGGCPWR